MATYKVPQDVEADDKLLGPFTFRQFIYLMIVLGMIMLTVAFFKFFPLLAAIPIPIAIFFAVLALPIKKDQPMETYLAALVSFYLKPHKRFWMPGQSNSTIEIIAPKNIEASRTRNISEEEASHRLSFLAEVVDTEGYAIKNASTPMRDEFYAEAYNTTDMFDQSGTTNLTHLITKEQQQHHEEVVDQMRAAIQESAYNQDLPLSPIATPSYKQRIIQPLSHEPEVNPAVISPNLEDLANNPNYSVATIEQEAKRLQDNNNNEVYVPLR